MNSIILFTIFFTFQSEAMHEGGAWKNLVNDQLKAYGENFPDLSLIDMQTTIQNIVSSSSKTYPGDAVIEQFVQNYFEKRSISTILGMWRFIGKNNASSDEILRNCCFAEDRKEAMDGAKFKEKQQKCLDDIIQLPLTIDNKIRQIEKNINYIFSKKRSSNDSLFMMCTRFEKVYRNIANSIAYAVPRFFQNMVPRSTPNNELVFDFFDLRKNVDQGLSEAEKAMKSATEICYKVRCMRNAYKVLIEPNSVLLNDYNFFMNDAECVEEYTRNTFQKCLHTIFINLTKPYPDIKEYTNFIDGLRKKIINIEDDLQCIETDTKNIDAQKAIVSEKVKNVLSFFDHFDLNKIKNLFAADSLDQIKHWFEQRFLSMIFKTDKFWEHFLVIDRKNENDKKLIENSAQLLQLIKKNMNIFDNLYKSSLSDYQKNDIKNFVNKFYRNEEVIDIVNNMSNVLEKQPDLLSKLPWPDISNILQPSFFQDIQKIKLMYLIMNQGGIEEKDWSCFIKNRYEQQKVPLLKILLSNYENSLFGNIVNHLNNLYKEESVYPDMFIGLFEKHVNTFDIIKKNLSKVGLIEDPLLKIYFDWENDLILFSKKIKSCILNKNDKDEKIDSQCAFVVFNEVVKRLNEETQFKDKTRILKKFAIDKSIQGVKTIYEFFKNLPCIEDFASDLDHFIQWKNIKRLYTLLPNKKVTGKNEPPLKTKYINDKSPVFSLKPIFDTIEQTLYGQYCQYLFFHKNFINALYYDKNFSISQFDGAVWYKSIEWLISMNKWWQKKCDSPFQKLSENKIYYDQIQVQLSDLQKIYASIAFSLRLEFFDTYKRMIETKYEMINGVYQINKDYNMKNKLFIVDHDDLYHYLSAYHSLLHSSAHGMNNADFQLNIKCINSLLPFFDVLLREIEARLTTLKNRKKDSTRTMPGQKRLSKKVKKYKKLLKKLEQLIQSDLATTREKRKGNVNAGDISNFGKKIEIECEQKELVIGDKTVMADYQKKLDGLSWPDLHLIKKKKFREQVEKLKNQCMQDFKLTENDLFDYVKHRYNKEKVLLFKTLLSDDAILSFEILMDLITTKGCELSNLKSFCEECEHTYAIIQDNLAAVFLNNDNLCMYYLKWERDIIILALNVINSKNGDTKKNIPFVNHDFRHTFSFLNSEIPFAEKLNKLKDFCNSSEMNEIKMYHKFFVNLMPVSKVKDYVNMFIQSKSSSDLIEQLPGYRMMRKEYGCFLLAPSSSPSITVNLFLVCLDIEQENLCECCAYLFSHNDFLISLKNYDPLTLFEMYGKLRLIVELHSMLARWRKDTYDSPFKIPPEKKIYYEQLSQTLAEWKSEIEKKIDNKISLIENEFNAQKLPCADMIKQESFDVDIKNIRNMCLAKIPYEEFEISSSINKYYEKQILLLFKRMIGTYENSSLVRLQKLILFELNNQEQLCNDLAEFIKKQGAEYEIIKRNLTAIGLVDHKLLKMYLQWEENIIILALNIKYWLDNKGQFKQFTTLNFQRIFDFLKNQMSNEEKQQLLKKFMESEEIEYVKSAYIFLTNLVPVDTFKNYANNFATSGDAFRAFIDVLPSNRMSGENDYDAKIKGLPDSSLVFQFKLLCQQLPLINFDECCNFLFSDDAFLKSIFEMVHIKESVWAPFIIQIHCMLEVWMTNKWDSPFKISLQKKEYYEKLFIRLTALKDIAISKTLPPKKKEIVIKTVEIIPVNIVSETSSNANANAGNQIEEKEHQMAVDTNSKAIDSNLSFKPLDTPQNLSYTPGQIGKFDGVPDIGTQNTNRNQNLVERSVNPDQVPVKVTHDKKGTINDKNRKQPLLIKRYLFGTMVGLALIYFIWYIYRTKFLCLMKNSNN